MNSIVDPLLRDAHEQHLASYDAAVREARTVGARLAAELTDR